MEPTNLVRLKKYQMHQKPHLPTKTCANCGKPFAWRKKWQKMWIEVKYCSERCGRNKNRLA
ncbi:DUF2256 domain-containing protein [Ekhidna sp.]|uniref:DUF2256 domain-containing protein n=1 Tax=Ekhidna sp. TaxID=2608089 RepID=UPI003B59B7FE